MGQKIHPVGLRLGISQEHRSIWFARPNQYANLLAKDQKIRASIKKYVQKYVTTSLKYAGISRIDIQFNVDLVQIEIHTAFPSLLIGNKNLDGDTTTGFEPLRDTIQKVIGHQKLKILFSEIANPYAEATILAEYIALQLENRVAFRKAMKKAIEFANEKGKVKGIKIQISGRLNGAEIARIEWAREGRVPLHTLRAKIDYCHCPAQTIYGVLGIKIWVFQK
jgi:small subunit ribosomal protein S3